MSLMSSSEVRSNFCFNVQAVTSLAGSGGPWACKYPRCKATHAPASPKHGRAQPRRSLSHFAGRCRIRKECSEALSYYYYLHIHITHIM